MSPRVGNLCAQLEVNSATSRFPSLGNIEIQLKETLGNSQIRLRKTSKSEDQNATLRTIELREKSKAASSNFWKHRDLTKRTAALVPDGFLWYREQKNHAENRGKYREQKKRHREQNNSYWEQQKNATRTREKLSRRPSVESRNRRAGQCFCVKAEQNLFFKTKKANEVKYV